MFLLVVFWGGAIGDFQRGHPLPAVSGHGYLLGEVAETHWNHHTKPEVAEVIIGMK